MDTTGKRKKYLINTKFQIKWTLIISLIGTICAGLFAAGAWYSINQQNEIIIRAIKTDDKLRNESQEVMIQLLNMPDRTDKEKEGYERRFYELKADFEKSKDDKSAVMAANRRARYIMIGFVAVIGIFLFLWGIVLTHRVAGPLYVIKSTLKRLAETGDLDTRPLRQKDEFKDIYHDIRESLEQISSDQETK